MCGQRYARLLMAARRWRTWRATSCLRWLHAFASARKRAYALLAKVARAWRYRTRTQKGSHLADYRAVFSDWSSVLGL